VIVGLIAPVPPPPGGIATWTKGLLEHAADDTRVRIIHIDSAIRGRRIEQLGFWRRVYSGCILMCSFLPRLLISLGTRQINVLHICSSGSFGLLRDVLVRTCAFVFRVPVVVHFRFGRLPEIAASATWETAMVKMLCSGGVFAIVLDTPSASALKSIAPKCIIQVVANTAWDLKPQSQTECGASETVLVFAGHVIPEKGVRELVLACREIKTPSFVLEILGPIDNTVRKELHTLAMNKSDGAWLNIRGPLPHSQVVERIASAYALILPSHTEGFPNVVVEAMTLGTPVIATPVGAIPEMLAVGDMKPCGICIPVGQTDALRRAIEDLLARPDFATKLGRRGQERAIREYSPERIYHAYRSVWEAAALERRRPQRRPNVGAEKPVLVAPMRPAIGGIASWAEGLLRFAAKDESVEIQAVDSSVRFRDVDPGLVRRAVTGAVCGIAVLAKLSAVLFTRHITALHLCSSGSLGLTRDMAVALLGRLRRVRVILHLHFGRLPSIITDGHCEAMCLRVAIALSSHVVLVDAASADCLRPLVRPGSISFIPNPAWNLAECRFNELDHAETRTVVFVGRVERRKGVFELVKACRDIERPAFGLKLVGPVSARFRRELEALAATKEGGRWLSFTGPVPNTEAVEHIVHALALALPSYSEGAPIAVLEAMMVGRPVIATPAGAIPAMLRLGTKNACGIEVPIGDVNALRAAIECLLERPDYARVLGRRGRQHVLQAYSPDAAYSMYRSLWTGSSTDAIRVINNF
jgi:glycosyltransferase involved in cell wall biosynthesis